MYKEKYYSIFPKELFRLAGKTDGSFGESAYWLPIWMHLEDTSEIMEALIQNWLPESVQRATNLSMQELIRVGKLLGKIHDIGKFTPVFLSNIHENLPGLDIPSDLIPRRTELRERMKTPHALAGQVILDSFGCNESISGIVGAHHGKPQRLEIDLNDEMKMYKSHYFGPKGKRNKALWEEIWEKWVCYAVESCGYDDINTLPDLSMNARVLLSGLLVVADWIASNPYYFPLLSVNTNGTLESYPERTENAWKKLGFPDLWIPEHSYADENTFESQFHFAPNMVQSAIMDVVNQADDPGIIILEAQMGVGKTEAALAAAEVLAFKKGCGGIFFGMPTQGTTNGIFPRIMEWAQTQSDQTKQSIRLAHGMAEMNEDYRDLFIGKASSQSIDASDTGVFVHQWFNGRKQALLADFVIGTVDQLLMVALKQKHVMLRHLGIAGKVVIIDECHAYDSYMNQYLDTALSWLGSYGIPVILLSATLPNKRRGELVRAYLGKNSEGLEIKKDDFRYPLLTWSDGSKIRQQGVAIEKSEKTVIVGKIHYEELIDTLSQKITQGGCVGIIVNTVQKAQDFADEICKSIPEATVILYHSRFTMEDRLEKEKAVLDRVGKKSNQEIRQKVIVIGTQVLEQSLDIDFDYLISELCPMDLLLQRIGRLQRHKNRERNPEFKDASIDVLFNDMDWVDEGTEYIYGKWLLLRTKDNLPKNVSLPSDIPILVDKVYTDITDIEKENELYRVSWDEFISNLNLKQNRAKSFCMNYASYEESFTSIDFAMWLDTESEDTENAGYASVRDGLSSLDVLIMVDEGADTVAFTPWQGSSDLLKKNHVPDDTICRKILRQKISLPHMFADMGDKVIKELEELNDRFLSEWQQSRWLKGELVLLLDRDMKSTLCGYPISYSAEKGLYVDRQKENYGTN